MAAAGKFVAAVGCFEPGELWPDALAWPDHYVADVEAVLAPTEVANVRITLDEWIAARAPLDLAPTPAYVRNGGVWRMENHPLVQAELERIGGVDVDLSVCASTAMWCESIAGRKA